MGSGWSGECFPVLTEFIDASGTLPVHLHADDEAAQRLEGQANGNTESWHVLAAAPGATALCGARDGVSPEQLRAALQDHDADAVLRRLPVRADWRPDFTAGLSVRVDDAVEQTFLCAGPYCALERWRAGTAAPLRRRFETAQVLSNVGAPITVTAEEWSGDRDAAETLLLPAYVGAVEIAGPADVLFGYLPDLDRDVHRPLAEAGYGPRVVALLGEGLG